MSYDRRVGERHPVSIDIDWDVGRRGLFRRRPRRARIEDLSVSGALIRVPAKVRPGPGDRVVIAVGDAKAVVVVRRVDAAANDAAAIRCAVMFVDADTQFSEMLSKATGVGPPEWVNWR